MGYQHLFTKKKGQHGDYRLRTHKHGDFRADM